MLPILLTILKIAGLAVLALLGLVMAVLLIILVVPVRYSLSGSFHERLRAKAKITWLFHGVSVIVTYDDELDIAVRLLGKRLFQEKAHKEELEEKWEDLEEDLEENLEEKWQELEEEWEVPEDGKVDEKETPKAGQAQSGGGRADAPRPGKPDKETRPPDRQKEAKGGQRQTKSRKTGQDRTEDLHSGRGSADAPGRFLRTMDLLKEKWNQLSEYKDRICTFVNDPENQQTGKLIFRQVKKMIRHVLPTKAQGKVVFGFDDPALTGKVLSGLSILYAWYGDKLQITPVFDQKILEGEGSLRGRLRLGTMAALAVRVFFNKNFRRLIRRFLRSGGK